MQVGVIQHSGIRFRTMDISRLLSGERGRRKKGLVGMFECSLCGLIESSTIRVFLNGAVGQLVVIGQWDKP